MMGLYDHLLVYGLLWPSLRQKFDITFHMMILTYMQKAALDMRREIIFNGKLNQNLFINNDLAQVANIIGSVYP